MDLVIGATGMLGSEIVGELRRRGRNVRALVRSGSAPERLAQLESLGVELVQGDLKVPATLAAVCEGVEHVISTASSTQSRRTGDSIDSVDQQGQLNLFEAARRAGVTQLVLVSFPHSQLQFPLQSAKRASEAALRASGIPYTVLQPPHFYETWFSPALGFDWRSRTVRYFGNGAAKVSFVSFKDVARVAAEVLGQPAALNQTLVFGGPSAISQRDMVAMFEAVLEERFRSETVDEGALQRQCEDGPDALSKSFAALMLLCGALGDFRVNNENLKGLVDFPFLSAEQFARASARG